MAMKSGFRAAFLVVSVAFLALLAAGVFILAVAPTSRLQADLEATSRLDLAWTELSRAAMSALALPVDAQASEIESAAQDAAELMARVRSPSFAGVADMFADNSGDESVAGLADAERAIGAKAAAVAGSCRRLADLAPRAFDSPDGASALSFISPDRPDADGSSLGSGADIARSLAADAAALSADVDAARGLLAAREMAIRQGIGRYRAISFAVSGLIIACTWFLGLVGVWLLARSVSRVTRRFSLILDRAASGDLTSCLDGIERGSGDPLLDRMVDFVSSLQRVCSSLKDQTREGLGASSALAESLENTSSTFEVVDGFIESIRNEATVLEGQVRIVKTALERVTAGLGHLDEQIGSQKSMVSGSTGSVGKMIASIGEMAERASRDDVLVRELVGSSEEGQSLFGTTYEKITTIRESVSKINGMAEVIDSIAEKTSMLALNAAIEAAHAGAAGKGFAVVAEEIAKLAEASSESSREIGNSIKEIVSNITDMADSSSLLDRAFTRMQEDIGSVSQSMSSFATGLAESTRGSREILSTMNVLEKVSEAVTGDSGTMADGAGAIGASMRELEMISSRVFDGIQALTLMVDGLKDVVGKFKEIAGTMSRTGEAMGNTLSSLQ
ncbi:MAG TPA: methyl-accepting chemotaxis protein [Treponemataceae bacterium]|nr:methyl-accepting chemotaxis protein [Treponemataceae bacterium]